MMKMILTAGFVLATACSFAQDKDVVDIAIGSKDHTTLVAAVKAADLVPACLGCPIWFTVSQSVANAWTMRHQNST